MHLIGFIICFGQKMCPKHVEFYSRNKFEKLVHLVGFIIRIYHNARSSECQIHAVAVLTTIQYTATVGLQMAWKIL
jgi:hypothetical protein